MKEKDYAQGGSKETTQGGEKGSLEGGEKSVLRKERDGKAGGVFMCRGYYAAQLVEGTDMCEVRMAGGWMREGGGFGLALKLGRLEVKGKVSGSVL